MTQLTFCIRHCVSVDGLHVTTPMQATAPTRVKMVPRTVAANGMIPGRVSVTRRVLSLVTADLTWRLSAPLQADHVRESVVPRSHRGPAIVTRLVHKMVTVAPITRPSVAAEHALLAVTESSAAPTAVVVPAEAAKETSSATLTRNV